MPLPLLLLPLLLLLHGGRLSPSQNPGGVRAMGGLARSLFRTGKMEEKVLAASSDGGTQKKSKPHNLASVVNQITKNATLQRARGVTINESSSGARRKRLCGSRAPATGVVGWRSFLSCLVLLLSAATTRAAGAREHKAHPNYDGHEARMG
jgi:hypothetical protein